MNFSLSKKARLMPWFMALITNLIAYNIYAENKVEGAQSIKVGFWHSILSAPLNVQLCVLALAIMSVCSWAVFLYKKKQFTVLETENKRFLDQFWKASSLEQFLKETDQLSKAPLSQIFRKSYSEMKKLAGSQLATPQRENDTKLSEDISSLSGIDNLERSLRTALNDEMPSLEKGLNFLATTGSSSPFIGLLGTVLGITHSFQKIAVTNSASLVVVAPGISEALYATAIGLFAAIPATFFYNILVSKVRKIELDMNNFGNDFLNIMKRNFFKEN